MKASPKPKKAATVRSTIKPKKASAKKAAAKKPTTTPKPKRTDKRKTDKTFDKKIDSLYRGAVKEKGGDDSVYATTLDFAKQHKERFKTVIIWVLLALLMTMTISFSAFNNGYRAGAIDFKSGKYEGL